MAKISKPVLKLHNEAVALLEKGELDFMDREFVYKNYHEGAGKMNNLISAHFTPREIALSMVHNVRCDNWVDIGAGIGMLSYTNMRFNHQTWEPKKGGFLGVCVENCTEYYEIGKKLLPECVWINGDIFDPKVVAKIKMIMDGEDFSILSNPPYGNQVKGEHPDMLYTGSLFEYKAMEMGAILEAYDGVFLVPQQSCPFRITGSQRYQDRESLKTTAYNKFVKQTGLVIEPNNGFSTEMTDDAWKDVSITTEIAVVEYDEGEYKGKINQLTMF